MIDEINLKLKTINKFYRIIFKRSKKDELPIIEIYSDKPKKEYLNSLILYDNKIIDKFCYCSYYNALNDGIVFLIEIFNEEERYYAVSEINHVYREGNNFLNYSFISKQLNEARHEFNKLVRKYKFNYF